MTMTTTHSVKVKEPTDKVWYFLTPRGGKTRLRFHAVMVTPERAAALVAELEELNPGVKAKVTPLFRQA